MIFLLMSIFFVVNCAASNQETNFRVDTSSQPNKRSDQNVFTTPTNNSVAKDFAISPRLSTNLEYSIISVDPEVDDLIDTLGSENISAEKLYELMKKDLQNKAKFNNNFTK